ncbi:hypothetical protein E2C01_092371 [Portunus trituberculatus]|uniref:Uncharacterized protein n=1 Tax=Portunus trituberculatus TaxID=210409 RepID=A0A5B7JJX3_PORTR|nr:hypothetical protein [Portunus trituberculatus]
MITVTVSPCLRTSQRPHLLLPMGTAQAGLGRSHQPVKERLRICTV